MSDTVSVSGRLIKHSFIYHPINVAIGPMQQQWHITHVTGLLVVAHFARVKTAACVHRWPSRLVMIHKFYILLEDDLYSCYKS